MRGEGGEGGGGLNTKIKDLILSLELIRLIGHRSDSLWLRAIAPKISFSILLQRSVSQPASE